MTKNKGTITGPEAYKIATRLELPVSRTTLWRWKNGKPVSKLYLNIIKQAQANAKETH